MNDKKKTSRELTRLENAKFEGGAPIIKIEVRKESNGEIIKVHQFLSRVRKMRAADKSRHYQ